VSPHHFIPHHLTMKPEHASGNTGRGRVFFLPGSDGRAQRIAERFSSLQVLPSDRRHNVFLGQLDHGAGQVDVGVVATGMGCPSLDIIVTELIQLGVRTLIRVGTAGSLRPDAVRAGSLVIATAAVRDEAASDAYATREVPAVADRRVVAALEGAAHRLGLADRTFAGLIHTKDSLYGREFGEGPRSEENQSYMRHLAGLGVLASEMEAAHLFILSQVHSREIAAIGTAADRVASGAVLAIIGDDTPFADKATTDEAEGHAVDVALEAAVRLQVETT
jgi:uridine phosphorylase